MSFPVELTSVLSGASKGQLSSWRKPTRPLLVPEIATRPKVLYSFRDVLALRTLVYLRKEVPLQRIRKAFDSLHAWDLTDHPSRYRLTTDGETIFLVDEDGATDLVWSPGQKVLAEIGDVFKPFNNRQGNAVVDFLNPRPRLSVRATRMGGWPTVAGTRVPYDTVANLVAGGDISYSEVSRHFPTVAPEDVPDAVSFDDQVRAAK